MTSKTGAGKGKVFEHTLQQYFATTASAEVTALISSIRAASSASERRKLKSQLPIRCPHYFRFKGNHRAQQAILPEEFTFQTCVDIDDEQIVSQALERAYLLNNKEGQWKDHLLHAEHSPSGKLHLDIRIPVGMTIEEAQRAYCQALGIAYDESCITPERMIYISDKASQLFTANGWYARLSDEEVAQRRKAYQDRGLTIDGRVCAGLCAVGGRECADLCAVGGRECAASSPKLGEARRGLNERMSEAGTSASGMSEAVPALVQTTPPIGTPPNLGGERDYPQDYMGIPYPYIVEEVADQLGGAPEHGSRNAFIYSLACHLRHVCNDDPQWIRTIMPNYGEAQDRVDATIDSACRRSQLPTMPIKVKNALTLARKRVNMEKGVDPESLMRQPVMPARLPAPVRLITSKAPRGYWPAIANTAFAAFATYTGGLKAEFWNGTLTELNQLHLLAAPMSTGKSSIKEPINHILKPIIDRDMVARQREKEWAEQTNTRSANKEKPERPKDICVQVVDSDMTNAAFCQRMEDAERAGNKALFTRMDELEQLKKLAGGSMAEVTEILRRDFDADTYGQERVGTQSVKSRTTMRHNIVVSTTPATAKKFLGDNIDNGTLSRLSLSTIVTDDVERRPMFKRYDELFDNKLAVYLARLESAKGTIVCQQAKNLAITLLDRSEERALMMGNESYIQLSYRAVDIAFRKSILLYIMNGMKWSRDIEEFIIWTFDYDLWVKMCILGQEISSKLEQDHRIMRPGVACLLEQLGDSFTRQEYEVLYKVQCPKAIDFKRASGNLLAQWKKRGWIEENTEQQIYCKTGVYYQKHAA